jgi:hypothetical protein
LFACSLVVFYKIKTKAVISAHSRNQLRFSEQKKKKTESKREKYCSNRKDKKEKRANTLWHHIATSHVQKKKVLESKSFPINPGSPTSQGALLFFFFAQLHHSSTTQTCPLKPKQGKKKHSHLAQRRPKTFWIALETQFFF